MSFNKQKYSFLFKFLLSNVFNVNLFFALKSTCLRNYQYIFFLPKILQPVHSISDKSLLCYFKHNNNVSDKFIKFIPTEVIMSNSKVKRNKYEIFQSLVEQIKFLSNDCLLFDNGDKSYGKRMSLTLRLLLYDSKFSHSLLRQIKDEFVFNYPDFIDISTTKGSLPNPETTNFLRTSMCSYLLNHTIESEEILKPQPIKINVGERYPSRSFNTWWEKNYVLSIDNKNFLTRKDIVTLLADQDGGAHVDPNFDERIAVIKRELANPIKINIPIDNSYKVYIAELRDILEVVVRSIAEETLYVFNNNIIPYCEKYLEN